MDEEKLQEIIAAARAESAAGSRVGDDLQKLVEIAETLAGTIARALIDGPPVLTAVTGTIITPGRVNAADALSARPAEFPRFHGEMATRELHAMIEVVDGDDRLVGYVRFVWAAS
jgi:hypothetical protein